MLSDPEKIVYYGGVALGASIILSVIFVYIKNGKIDFSALLFSLIGFSLFGLSIWKTLDVNLKSGEVKVEIWQLQSRSNPTSTETPVNLRPSVTSPIKYSVTVLNLSSSVDDQEVAKVVSALKKQIDEDVGPIWSVGVDLTFKAGSKEPSSPDSWLILILDESDFAASLGYHDVGVNGLPSAKVYARSAKKIGASWTMVASHELIDILVDPRINSNVFVSNTSDQKSRLYPFEPAMPCGAEPQSYMIDGTKVSNFVYPSWFQPNAKPGGKFDHMGYVKKPLELCQGGFIPVYEFTGGNWIPLWGP